MVQKHNTHTHSTTGSTRVLMYILCTVQDVCNADTLCSALCVRVMIVS